VRGLLPLLAGLALVALGAWLRGAGSWPGAGGGGPPVAWGPAPVATVVVSVREEDRLYSGGVIWLEAGGRRYNATWVGNEAVFAVEPGTYVLGPSCCSRLNAVRAPGRYRAFYGGGCWFLVSQG